MEGVPKDIGRFGRIIGPNLAKKTFKGCILTEEKNFEDRKIITGEMDPDGRMHFITEVAKEGDLIAMEGGTSSFNFAREITEYSSASVVVLNPVLGPGIKRQPRTNNSNQYVPGNQNR